MDSTALASATRVEVDLTARKLYLFNGADTAETYSVAVGSQRWPTQTGEWKITQVVWNPEWIPPDESWAEEREPRKPGDPKNPLGRVQLVYDPPRTIHGTTDPSSIGKAVSHGSIRMTNEKAAELGKLLMDAAGVGKDSAFYRNVQRNRTEKVVVDLPRGVPIRVF
jgi:lipoprotein-anchoring transpeptidase ErfK/SrfK